MARRPRIDLPGFHHVVNRGVDKRMVKVSKAMGSQAKGSGDNDNPSKSML